LKETLIFLENIKGNIKMKLIFKPSKKKIQVIKPVKLRFFNTSKFPKRSKAEWGLIDRNPFGDSDKDGVKNFFDCKPLNRKKQGFIHRGINKGKYKVYSLRPYSETYTGEIHPADTTDRMSYGRDTGYFGTGIYGFNTKKTALQFKEKEHATKEDYGSQARRHIREFVVDKPLVLKKRYQSDQLFEASKLMNQARTGDKEDQEKLWRAKYKLQEAGINASDEEIKRAVYAKRAKWSEKEGNKDQPITMLLKEKGYGGVIPSKEYQTFHDGSVIHVYQKIEKDTKPLTKFEKQDKEIAKKIQHQINRESRKYQGKEDFFDKEVPSMITGEIKKGKSIAYKEPKFMDEEDQQMADTMRNYDRIKMLKEELKESLKE